MDGLVRNGDYAGGMSVVRVAELDPELFEAVSDPEAAAAASAAESEWLDTGTWDPGPIDRRGHYGLLVLEGAFVRRVRLGPRDAAELLGPGDIGRPWVSFGGDSSISLAGGWTVHQRARIAFLDRRFAGRVAAWPEV